MHISKSDLQNRLYSNRHIITYNKSLRIFCKLIFKSRCFLQTKNIKLLYQIKLQTCILKDSYAITS